MSRIRTIIISALTLTLLIGCGETTSNYEYKAEDISDILEKAEKKYEAEEYEDSLECYTDAMLGDAKSIEARIGAIKCEMALEQYDLAERDLFVAAKVAPKEVEIYDLYFELSEAKNSLSPASTAVSLAERNNVTEIVDKMPEMPEIDTESGEYQEGFFLTIDSEDDVFYSLTNETYNRSVYMIKYTHPVYIADGKTAVTVCAVRDGIPSKEVKASYNVKEKDGEVTFADPLVEKLVRISLEADNRPITQKELNGLENLDFDDISKDSEYKYEERENYKLSTLEDLKKMPFLRTVDMTFQDSVSDFSPLSYCQFLDSFYWRKGELKDSGSMLSYLGGVTRLYLQNNQLSSLNGIDRLSSLRSLYVDGNPGIDLTGIEKLHSLDTLCVDDDVTNFDLNEKITDLQIYGFDFDRDKVAKLEKIDYLYIHYKEYNGNWDNRPMLTDLGFLEKMPQLNSLYLYYVKDPAELEHVKVLQNLKQLRIYSSDAIKEDGVLDSLKQALPDCNIST